MERSKLNNITHFLRIEPIMTDESRDVVSYETIGFSKYLVVLRLYVKMYEKKNVVKENIINPKASETVYLKY